MTRRLLLLLLAAFLANAAAAQPLEIHSKHFIKGYPIGTPASNDLIIRDLYAMSSNDRTKFADWVAYRLTPVTVSGSSGERNWEVDPWLDDDETLEPGDYEGAFVALNTHRGHQAPLAALNGTGHAHQTNYLSNITPQKGPLNSGSWQVMESRIRALLEDKVFGEVYVMTGPLYEEEMPDLPGADETHRVPSGYWKIVAVPGEHSLQTAAFIMDQNTPRSSPVMDYLVSIDEVEQRSGLDFFWELGEHRQNRLEGGMGRDWAARWFSGQ
ncbi:MAG: DNA/RNA non-specific endonuclease [Balneolaceae bacterium]|nr:DNA/RNA non-specific endonuclease [Balneolaceae bacterium]